MSDIVAVRTYGLELDAQMDAAVLEANGIPAHVSGAMGNVYPGVSVRLLVRSEDAELALEILDAPAQPEDEPVQDGHQAPSA